MKRVMVRYKLKAELNTKQPEGLRYASFGFPDGLTFIHIALIETADGKNPLGMTEAFPLFTKDIKDRCEEPPVAMDLNEIGSYHLFS